VEAPEGAQADPIMPLSRMTSASTVGLPRESNTSRALIAAIFAIRIDLHYPSKYDSIFQEPCGLLGIQDLKALHQIIQSLHLTQEGFQLAESQGTGAVTFRLIRVRVGCQEEARQANGHAGTGQVRHLLTATAGCIGQAARHLKRVGHVEKHGVFEL